MTDRRSFLSGLISLPLIGGGVTLIGRPAAPVPLAQALAVPAIADPRARFTYAWEALSSAMREITPANAHGWFLAGGQTVAFNRHLQGGHWVRAQSVHYEVGAYPNAPTGVTERHEELDLATGGQHDQAR